MPFSVDIGYEERMLGEPLPEIGVVDRWLVKDRAILSADDPVAVLVLNGRQVTVHVRFSCMVGRLVAEKGERLHLGSVLLSVMADGEEIPEGFRYCFLT